MKLSNLLISGAVLAAAPAFAQTTATAQKQVLLQADHSWNGAAYTSYPAGTPQLTMLKLTIAANTALPWHTHPFPNAGYVLSGELTLHDRQSGKSHTYHAGEAFAETVDDAHRGGQRRQGSGSASHLCGDQRQADLHTR